MCGQVLGSRVFQDDVAQEIDHPSSVFHARELWGLISV